VEKSGGGGGLSAGWLRARCRKGPARARRETHHTHDRKRTQQRMAGVWLRVEPRAGALGALLFRAGRAGRPLAPARAAHVGHQRPRRAAKANHGHRLAAAALGTRRRRQPPRARNALKQGRESHRGVGPQREARKVARRSQRRGEHRAWLHAHLQPHGLRDDQNVAENHHRVERGGVPPQRLQRRLRAQRGVVAHLRGKKEGGVRRGDTFLARRRRRAPHAHLKKICRGAQRAELRQVAPRLPHGPHRHARRGLATQRAQHNVVRHRGQVSSLLNHGSRGRSRRTSRIHAKTASAKHRYGSDCIAITTAVLSAGNFK
jgi:hypothetical protein